MIKRWLNEPFNEMFLDFLAIPHTISTGFLSRARTSMDRGKVRIRLNITWLNQISSAPLNSAQPATTKKSPYGVWVKSNHLEWKEGPYAKQGVKCHDCHMTYALVKSVSMGNNYPDVRQRLFHGAHDPGKIRGTIELHVHPDINEAAPGDKVKFTIVLFNQKTGHKFPSGSV